jgi:hypothetical protein
VNISENKRRGSVEAANAGDAKASTARSISVADSARNESGPVAAKKIGQGKGSPNNSKRVDTVVVDQVLAMRLLNERQVSEILRTPMGTLRRWRCVGVGPLYIKLGGGAKAPVRYDPIDIYECVEAGRRFASIRAGNMETKHGD